MGFTTCKWSVQFRCCALWNRSTVIGDYWCIRIPGKALDWRHHQNWVYAQLHLTSPYFSDARDLGLITSHEPYFDTLDLGLLPYTSWVKLGEGPCASNKGPHKKRGKRRPWEAAFPILLGQKWSDQSRRWSILSAAFSFDILDPVMKQRQQWRALGNLNITLHRTLANILNCNCRSYLETPLHPSTMKFVCTFGLRVFLFVHNFCTATKSEVLCYSYNVEKLTPSGHILTKI